MMVGGGAFVLQSCQVLFMLEGRGKRQSGAFTMALYGHRSLALVVGLAVSVLGHGALWFGLRRGPELPSAAPEPVFLRVVQPTSPPIVAPALPPMPVLVADVNRPASVQGPPPAQTSTPPPAAHAAKSARRSRPRLAKSGDGVPVAQGGEAAPQEVLEGGHDVGAHDGAGQEPAPSAGGGQTGGRGDGGGTGDARAARATVELGAYATQVREAILAHRYYPPLAARQGLEGTVVLRVRSRPDGHLAESTVVLQSSGHAGLDEAAVGFVSAAVPLPAAPAGAPPIMEFHVPLRFALDDEG
jgi:TonB family protein